MSLEALKPGETIRLREGNTWSPAVVRSCLGSPQAESQDDGIYRRNRRDILRDTGSFQAQTFSAFDDYPPRDNQPQEDQPQENQSQATQPHGFQPQDTQLRNEQPRETRPWRIIYIPARLKD